MLGASVRLADPARLGRAVNVLCQVRMHRQTIDARADFEQFIQSREEIVECYAMSGEWDYLLRIAVRDVADYDRFIRQGVLAHPSVANAASNFALRQVKYTTEISGCSAEPSPLPSLNCAAIRSGRRNMAARPYWKGQIRLALVSIPVEIYSATRSGATDRLQPDPRAVGQADQI